MSELLVNTIKKADGTGSLTVPAESGTVVTTASPSLGRRNLIINGAMQVAQRGTSFTGQEYTLDRWRQSLSGGTSTVTQETFSSGDEIAQSKNYLRQDVSTGDNFLGLIQRVEGVRSISSGETVTFSFYAKGTNPAGGGLNFHVEQRFGTGGSPSSNVVVFDSDSEIVLTSNWTRYTITFTFTDYSGKTFGSNNDDFVQIEIRQIGSDTSTDAWTLDITGVQLEVGSVASSYEHRSYGEELALCERYFQSWGGGNAYEYLPLFGGAVSGTRIEGVMQYKRDMRTTPDISYSGNWQWLDGVSTFTFGNILKDSIALNSVRISDNALSGLTQYRFYLVRANNDSTARFKLDAEL